MSNSPMLHPDLREPARMLIATGRIRSETDPEWYKEAVSGRKELSSFFQTELGWPLDTSEVARLVKLHKRRSDPPADRGPRLIRDGRSGPLAPAVVLVLEMLICEQLWRRPRMILRAAAGGRASMRRRSRFGAAADVPGRSRRGAQQEGSAAEPPASR